MADRIVTTIVAPRNPDVPGVHIRGDQTRDRMVTAFRTELAARVTDLLAVLALPDDQFAVELSRTSQLSGTMNEVPDPDKRNT